MRRAPVKLESAAGYHDLVADLKRPGCPGCHVAHRAAWRYLDSLLWEFVNDPGTRERLRAATGFCREHSMMAIRVASAQAGALGMAIIYRDLLGLVRRQVDDDARDGRRRRGRPRASHVKARCPACESADRAAATALGVLAGAEVGTVPWEGIRRPNRGLCLAHLEMGLGRHPEQDKAERLRAAYRHGESELRAHLDELIRKHDYRFHAEGLSDDEADAWKRAVFRLVGEPPSIRRPER